MCSSFRVVLNLRSTATQRIYINFVGASFIMKFCHASSLLLCCHLSFAAASVAGVSDEEKRNIQVPTEEAQWTKTGKLRRLQADSFFPDDDPYWNPNGIMERKPCIEFEAIRPEQLSNPLADEQCSSNDCGGGCCRNYNWILCDTDSSFAYLQCSM